MIAVLCNVVLLDALIEGGRLPGGGRHGSRARQSPCLPGRQYGLRGRLAGPALSEIMSVFLRKHTGWLAELSGYSLLTLCVHNYM